MNDIKALSPVEKRVLSDTPIFVTLFAANHDGLLTKEERQLAIKIAKIKAFSAPASIRFLYQEIAPVFEQQLTQLDRQLPAGVQERQQILTQQFHKTGAVLTALSPNFQINLLNSWKSFLWYISRMHDQSNWEEFVLPCIIDYIHSHDNHNRPIAILQKLMGNPSVAME